MKSSPIDIINLTTSTLKRKHSSEDQHSPNDPLHHTAKEQKLENNNPEDDPDLLKIKQTEADGYDSTLYAFLMPMLTSFKERDLLGIFLEPVDTVAIEDYLSVVETPMDFGTMEDKIEDKVYKTLEEFHHDFKLVVGNCKKYNSSNSVFYKTAHRISQFGEKAFEKKRKELYPESDDGQSFDEKKSKTIYDSVVQKRSYKKSYQRKMIEDRWSERILPDGSSLISGNNVEDPFKYVRPQSLHHQFLNESSLNYNCESVDTRLIENKYQFCGPYPSIDFSKNPDMPFDEVEYYTMGDPFCKAYFDSMERFVKDLDPKLVEHVKLMCAKLSIGMSSFKDSYVDYLGKTEEEQSINSKFIIPEMGEVDFKQITDTTKDDLLRQKNEAEILEIRKKPCDVSILLTPVFNLPDSTQQTQMFMTANFNVLINENRKDLAMIETMQKVPGSEEKIKYIQEMIRKRLVCILKRSPKTDDFVVGAAAVRPSAGS